jgi:hypothetical protein
MRDADLVQLRERRFASGLLVAQDRRVRCPLTGKFDLCGGERQAAEGHWLRVLDEEGAAVRAE